MTCNAHVILLGLLIGQSREVDLPVLIHLSFIFRGLVFLYHLLMLWNTMARSRLIITPIIAYATPVEQ